MKQFYILLLLPLLTFGQFNQKAPQSSYQPVTERFFPEDLDLPSTSWLDYSNTTWYNPEGNDYQITTAEEFAGLADLVLSGVNFSGKTIKLMADLDLGEHVWTPIGSGVDFPFSGVFEGNNHTISNLYINKPNDSFIGLFGHVVEAVIMDVKLNNAEVYGKDTVGALVANVYTSEVYNCHVENVQVIASDYNIGGLGGSILTNSIMENCSAKNVTVSGESQIGGLLGSIWDSSALKNSFSTGEASGSYIIGGLVGFTTIAFVPTLNTVHNCFSRVNVQGSLGRVGGLYGMADGALEIKNSYATGTAVAPEFAGGFIGMVSNMETSNNFFDLQTSNHNQAVGGWAFEELELDVTARETESMKTVDFVAQLNQNSQGENPWIMGESWNDFYPILTQTLKVSNSVQQNLDIQIYPNPVSNHLYIKSEKEVVSLEVYNSFGQLISIAKNTSSLPVSNLSKGVYIIKIKTAHATTWNKFIKK